jgi:hypothetical protein
LLYALKINHQSYPQRYCRDFCNLVWLNTANIDCRACIFGSWFESEDFSFVTTELQNWNTKLSGAPREKSSLKK